MTSWSVLWYIHSSTQKNWVDLSSNRFKTPVACCNTICKAIIWLFCYRGVSNECTSIAGTPCSEFYGHSTFPNVVSPDFNTSKARFDRYKVIYTESDCSEYTKIYLCLALMPPCDPSTGSSVGMGPCESLCQVVKNNCSILTRVLISGGNDISCIFSKCDRYVSIVTMSW